MYVYLESEHSQLWTVGFYKPDGKWEPESDHNSADSAAKRVAYLNGAREQAPDDECDHRAYNDQCAICRSRA